MLAFRNRDWKLNAVIVAALALGIGANVAIFSALDAVLLRSLPVRQPEQIYFARNGLPAQPVSTFASDVVERMRALAPTAQFAAFTGRYDFFVPGQGAPPQPVAASLVSTNYFTLLGIRAVQGRLFDAGDRAAPAAVLSYAWWQSHYNRAPVVGRTLTLNGLTVAIVGVAAPGFYGLNKARPPEIWLPLGLQQRVHYAGSAYIDSDRGTVDPTHAWQTQTGIRWLQVVARVPQVARLVGIAAAATQAQRRAEAPFLARAEPDSRASKSRDAVWFVPGSTGLAYLSKEVAAPLEFLLGMAGLVLLIACADVALLLLARGMTRRRDWAVRLALGAGQGRVVRQALGSALALAAAGTAAGVALALWGRGALLALLGTRLPAGAMALDGRVLAFAIAAALITGVLFGLAPAWLAARVNVNGALKDEASGSLAASTGGWTWLIGAQVALSLMLLFAASLLALSFSRLLRMPTGFAAASVITARIMPRSGGYTPAQLPALEQRLLTRLAAAPGVATTAVAANGAVSGSSGSSYLNIEPTGPRHVAAQEDAVSPGYFRALGVPLRRGRAFRAGDDEHARQVVIVNQAFVRAFLAGANPLGVVVNDYRDATIVGIVANAHVNGADQRVPPMVYHPLAQHSAYPTFLAVRFQGDPGAGYAEIRHVLAQVAPAMPVGSLHTLQERLRAGLGGERSLAELSGAFAALALLLAALGIYGVLGYAVAQRKQEVGIRMALGARPGQILRLVLQSAAVMVGLGAGVGLALALPLAALLRHDLHGLTPLDPAAIALALGALLLAGFAAALLPALRAARVAPWRALRRE